MPFRRYLFLTLFILVCAGLYWYWATTPQTFTVFRIGYTNAGAPPNPGTFQNARIDDAYHWWMVWLLSCNALPILLLGFALLMNDVEEWTRLHYRISVIMIGANIVVFVMLTISWFLLCNNGASGARTACNSYLWCGYYFPSPWCENTMAFTPPVTYAQLSRNGEMTQHWIFSIVFGGLSCLMVLYNGELREYGVLH